MYSFYPSQIIEYLYCARFTYFEYVLRIPQFEDKFHKVQRGRDIHQEKLERNKSYLRKKIGAVDKWQDQYLTMEGLRGKVDEVLLLADGSYAPLDYKFAEWKEKLYDTYRQQLICYAVLIEQNYKRTVNKGYLIYTRSSNKLVEVPIDQQSKREILKSMDFMAEIISKNQFPKGTKFKQRCLNCTYKNICIQ
ncbi:CRISPR-associated protein Cas4 [Algoriphagus pacificus]|uniref:CRISPR-associated exonuclease Cas4 n=1 Tax=Algoriphagus pacificus TaxID=2811234 RepID=A0ABS3CLX6_9BACT|nr:CRISPR-associated protein Cas4 [Algoriphagus pacificus]MBN7818088.1 CRISPR-associated protein Cas4 [Algoriphagus pacificus]